MTLPASFYDRPVLEVAQDLVGCVVEHDGAAGVIVETEAYHHSEPAAHSYVGLTARSSVLFREAGTAYVYRSYGIHALLNAVCEGLEVGAAVLLRALEPIEGVALMRERRGVARDVDLANGPGKLTQALGVDLELNATSLVEGPILIHPREAGWTAPTLIAGPRVGITKAVELPWRFSAAGSPYVSRPWPPGLRETIARVPRVPRVPR
ncbi:MAG TPA: DNA-3-methyladenine glycosylase [Baekduia sp.]|nr:DNA-3-methyladenine glycosylase [Baekduia sp.]